MVYFLIAFIVIIFVGVIHTDVQEIRYDKARRIEYRIKELLDLVEGKTLPGITTYPNGDDNNRKLHMAVMELEKLGKAKRHLETETHVVWMPVEGL